MTTKGPGSPRVISSRSFAIWPKVKASSGLCDHLPGLCFTLHPRESLKVRYQNGRLIIFHFFSDQASFLKDQFFNRLLILCLSKLFQFFKLLIQKLYK